jgi:heme-degrading monooxygenase HmoA
MSASEQSSPYPAGLAHTPEPPYYAVIFTSQRTEGDKGYGAMADRMVALAAQQPGFLGVESVRDAAGLGITVSYWRDEDAIASWQRHAEHLVAQRVGRERWYAGFELRVARVERVRSARTIQGGELHAAR